MEEQGILLPTIRVRSCTRVGSSRFQVRHQGNIWIEREGTGRIQVTQAIVEGIREGALARAAELLSQGEVRRRISILAKRRPDLEREVSEGGRVPLPRLHQELKNRLDRGWSIRNLEEIVEELAGTRMPRAAVPAA
jgi:flagellar biosynthesis component FlhA